MSVLARVPRSYALPDWAKDVDWYEVGDDPNAYRSTYEAAVASAERIFNLAGPSGAAASNADPFHNLAHLRCQIVFLEACAAAAHRPHVVFTSSRLVYGRTGPHAVDESHSLAPRSMYAVHKIGAENYHRVFGLLGHLTYTICRISNAYGFDAALPGTGCRIINQFIKNSLEGKQITLFGNGSQLRDFIHVTDVVRALQLASVAGAAHNEIFNIGSGEQVSMYQAANLITALTGGKDIRYVPWPSDFSLVESGDFIANIGKARAQLDFEPELTFAEGLRATIHDYKCGGELAPVHVRFAAGRTT